MLKSFINQKKRYLRDFKKSFDVSLESWDSYRNISRFDESVYKKEFFCNKFKSSIIKGYAPYPILVSNSSGLAIIKDNKIFNILTTFNGFYIFGIAYTGKKLIVSLNYHLPVKSRFDLLINKRLTLLLGVELEEINNCLNNKSTKINWQILFDGAKKNYSYLNYYDGKLYAVDYLGTIDEFEFEGKTSSMKKISSINLLENIIQSPPYFYPFLHLNCISIDKNNIYAGSHAYSRMTNFGSCLYKINRNTKNIELDRKTDFVSGHDMMKISNDFYGVDSENERLVKNDYCIYKCNEKSFLRGLSVNKNGFVLGSSVFSKKRSDRYKMNKNNKILFLDKDGSLINSIKPNLSAIYKVHSLNTEELTQSSPIKISLDL